MPKCHAQKNFAQISHQISIKVGRNGQNFAQKSCLYLKVGLDFWE